MVSPLVLLAPPSYRLPTTNGLIERNDDDDDNDDDDVSIRAQYDLAAPRMPKGCGSMKTRRVIEVLWIMVAIISGGAAIKRTCELAVSW